MTQFVTSTLHCTWQTNLSAQFAEALDSMFETTSLLPDAALADVVGALGRNLRCGYGLTNGPGKQFIAKNAKNMFCELGFLPVLLVFTLTHFVLLILVWVFEALPST